MTTGYIICLVAALGLLLTYSIIVKQKEFWLTMLHVCVSVVNLGYLLMSLSSSVEFAVFGNDVAYLGSVFLPMCMLLTIVRLCGFEIKNAHVITCVTLGALMFAVIVSSPMLPLYYKSLDIEMIDGSARLVKEYGVLHPVYLVYLLAYFVTMIGAIIHSIRRKKIGNPRFAGFIAAIVCGNLVIWLFEKMVSWEYEFLSVTYIISEFLLLIVYWMLQDYVYINDLPKKSEECQKVILVNSAGRQSKVEEILSHLPEGTSLSPRQLDILEGILDGRTRKEIAADLYLSENTVKMHTSSLYKALGVSGRDEIYRMLKTSRTK